MFIYQLDTLQNKSTALLRDSMLGIILWLQLILHKVQQTIEKNLCKWCRIYNFIRTNPDQNYDGHINAAVLHDIGKSTDMSMDAYIAEYNFIDGLALDASYFGETDNTYGHWKPIKYAGAYGNEGFYLDFKSSGVGTASSSTVGADRSGNDIIGLLLI